MTRAHRRFTLLASFALAIATLCSSQTYAQYTPSTRDSTVSVTVTFKNVDSKPIVCHWVDYEGNLNEGTTVQPGETTGGGTGDGHNYVFTKAGNVIKTLTLTKEPEQVYEIRAQGLTYKDQLEFDFVTEFTGLWSDFGSGSKIDGSFYRPKTKDGFYALGDLAVGDYNDPTNRKVVVTVRDISPNQDALRPPVRWEGYWSSLKSDMKATAMFMRPVPPEGYVALGMVTHNSFYGAPDLNAFRCIREDLVQPAVPGKGIWSNVGKSGDETPWMCTEIKSAASNPGEASVSPGTFLGAATWNGYATHACAYSLRMTLPELKTNDNFQPPQLTSFAPPVGFENLERTYISSVPWYTVNDPQLSDAQKIKNSPMYSVVRRDTYRLLAHYYNQTDKDQSQEESWTVGFSETDSKNWSETTGISFTVGTKETAKVGELGSAELSFSTTLSQNFTHGWSNSKTKTSTNTVKLPISVKPQTAVALFQVQSKYTVHRGGPNGVQIGSELNGSSDKSWFITQYPSAK